MKLITIKHIYIFLFVALCSCSNNDEPQQAPALENLEDGSGMFSYNYSTIHLSKTLNIYYYIPTNKTPETPVLFVFHGTGRNAEDYRNAMITKSEALGFIVVAPEFSNQNFPGGDSYNLGNVFVDGDNPSATTLNVEDTWTFSIIEPLFDYLKTQINNSNETYNVFGHSAGAQFTHRFMMFKPNARIGKVVASASGWYTFPDTSIPFPYGFDDSPLENSSLTSLFSKNIYIQIGENDDNSNAFGLRHDDYADAQGLNRESRANNFFQYCQNLAEDNMIPFNWSFYSNVNADHDYTLASDSAVDLLFN